MSLTFARTKIQPPRPRPGVLLARAALHERLVPALLAQPLVLVCAAAGFGKTSALTQAIEQLPAGTALAWVGCDEGDTPLQLFSCLLAALEPYDLPWRTAPEALIAAAVAADGTPATQAKAQRAVAAELINALDASEVAHGVIMIDDLHRIEHPAVYAFLDLLLERFTPRWTLAIASRHEPPLKLARLRARAALAEFRLDDLRLDAAQASTLAERAGLSAEAGVALFERTQGWPAGLQLALNVLRAAPGAPLAASAPLIDRQVFDFLATEVLDRLPTELREFLLTTSVLPELTAARCAALTGDAHAARMLDAIERAGLFVTTLPEPEPTLRLHDLLRDALEHRLRRERPQAWPALLERAAAGEPDGLRRISLLLRAQAFSAAEAALCEIGEDLATQGAVPAVRGLLARFPPAQVAASPGLQLLCTQLAWSRWDWSGMVEASAAAVAAYARNGDTLGQARARSYRCIALGGSGRTDEARALVGELLAGAPPDDAVAARALLAASWFELARGDQRRLAALWTRLLDHLQRLPSLARWYECMPLPPYIGLPGMRAPMLAYVQAAQRRWPERPSPPRGMCVALEGLLHLWSGDVERAQACASLADEDSRWLARPVNLDSQATLLQGLLWAVTGRGADAQALAERLIADVRATGDLTRERIYLGLYLYMAMRFAAAASDDAGVVRAARRVIEHERGDYPGWLSRQHAASTPAYLAAASGDWASAIAAWSALLEREHESDLYGQIVETRLRLADALLRSGAPAPEAAAALAPMFERIAASGEWGPVLMAGPALLGRLAVAMASALPADDAARLAQWAARSRALTAGAALPTSVPATPPTATEALSSRELEVLARIAAGDSNKLIARTFDLSPHTVKRHVANILDKLDLRSRGQAAAWYHQHAA